jgi:hypothetical protein
MTIEPQEELFCNNSTTSSPSSHRLGVDVTISTPLSPSSQNHQQHDDRSLEGLRYLSTTGPITKMTHQPISTEETFSSPPRSRNANELTTTTTPTTNVSPKQQSSQEMFMGWLSEQFQTSLSPTALWKTPDHHRNSDNNSTATNTPQTGSQTPNTSNVIKQDDTNDTNNNNNEISFLMSPPPPSLTSPSTISSPFLTDQSPFCVNSRSSLPTRRTIPYQMQQQYHQEWSSSSQQQQQHDLDDTFVEDPNASSAFSSRMSLPTSHQRHFRSRSLPASSIDESNYFPSYEDEEEYLVALNNNEEVEPPSIQRCIPLPSPLCNNTSNTFLPLTSTTGSRESHNHSKRHPAAGVRFHNRHVTIQNSCDLDFLTNHNEGREGFVGDISSVGSSGALLDSLGRSASFEGSCVSSLSADESQNQDYLQQHHQYQQQLQFLKKSQNHYSIPPVSSSYHDRKSYTQPITTDRYSNVNSMKARGGDMEPLPSLKERIQSSSPVGSIGSKSTHRRHTMNTTNTTTSTSNSHNAVLLQRPASLSHRSSSLGTHSTLMELLRQGESDSTTTNNNSLPPLPLTQRSSTLGTHLTLMERLQQGESSFIPMTKPQMASSRSISNGSGSALTTATSYSSSGNPIHRNNLGSMIAGGGKGERYLIYENDSSSGYEITTSSSHNPVVSSSNHEIVNQQSREGRQSLPHHRRVATDDARSFSSHQPSLGSVSNAPSSTILLIPPSLNNSMKLRAAYNNHTTTNKNNNEDDVLSFTSGMNSVACDSYSRNGYVSTTTTIDDNTVDSNSSPCSSSLARRKKKKNVVSEEIKFMMKKMIPSPLKNRSRKKINLERSDGFLT